MTSRLTLPQPASLDGFHVHFDVEDCLMFVARDLGRLNVDEDALLEYQRRLLQDLTSPLDEWALAQLHKYWEYDLESLTARGRGWRRGVPAKPRIDLIVELTTKDNLKAEWYPQRWELSGETAVPGTQTDFPGWYRQEHRYSSFDSRPSNELLFLHGVGMALRTLDRPSPYGHPLRILDHVLLRGASRAVERLKARLNEHFEVRLLRDVFTEWSDPGFGRRFDRDPPRLLKWEIEDPAKRQAREEIAEIEALKDVSGFSAGELKTALATCTRKRRTGPAPAHHTLIERVTKELKATGLPATKGKVERALALLRKHRGSEVDEATGGSGAAT